MGMMCNLGQVFSLNMAGIPMPAKLQGMYGIVPWLTVCLYRVLNCSFPKNWAQARAVDEAAGVHTATPVTAAWNELYLRMWNDSRRAQPQAQN